jgi:hypothetical protein
VLSILATCLFAIVYSAAGKERVSDLRAIAIAIGTTALFVFQPLMREFIAWPRLVLHLECLIFSALSLFSLIQWIKEPLARKWVWLAAIFAYSSMHCYGGGFATVLGLIAVFGIFLVASFSGQLQQFLPVRRTLLTVFAITLLFAGGHAACMHFLRASPLIPTNFIHVDGPTVLGFIGLAFLSALHALISFNPPDAFSHLVAGLWPWGVFLIAAAMLFLIALARSYRQKPTVDCLTQFALHAFSIVAFCAYILQLAARDVTEPGATTIDFHNFLLGARYLLPANFMLFGSFAAIAMTFARRSGRLAAISFLLIGLAAFITTKQGLSTYQSFSPGNAISHGNAWRALVSLARESRSANLPVPNIPMQRVTDFDWDLKLYEPLLRYSLHLSAEDKIEFEPWEKMRGAELEKYEAVAPSLRHVIPLFGLQPPG